MSDEDEVRAAIQRHLDSRRADPDFMRRLEERMRVDADVLARLRDDRPCPARVVAVLGLPEPVTLPCGKAAGHGPDHEYRIRWHDADPQPGKEPRP